MRVVYIVLIALVMILQTSCPISTALLLHVEGQVDDSNVDPVPDAPQWIEIPQNVTLEYGERFSLTVNVSTSAAAWAISDEQNFKINWRWGAYSATIKDNGALPIGVYFLRIYVWDLQYSGISADIWITVVDSHIPEIESPGVIEYLQGSNRSMTFSWIASDANPVSYLITLNTALVEMGDWVDEERTFTVSIGHLRKGTYIYELTLEDIGGNIASDRVTVHVTSDGSETVVISHDYLVNRNAERYVYVDPPKILFIEVFAIFVLSGLVGLVMVAAVAGKGHEFGFN